MCGGKELGAFFIMRNTPIILDGLRNIVFSTVPFLFVVHVCEAKATQVARDRTLGPNFISVVDPLAAPRAYLYLLLLSMLDGRLLAAGTGKGAETGSLTLAHPLRWRLLVEATVEITAELPMIFCDVQQKMKILFPHVIALSV